MNKKNITVLINGNLDNSQYLDFLANEFELTIVKANNYSGEKLDLILFIGGEDVSPNLYSENLGKYTSINKNRDNYELDLMFYAFPEIPKLGICRGSQFLTVASGGKLIQHVNGHSVGKLHEISFNYNLLLIDQQNILITSTHHQMMFPYNLNKEEYSIIATSKFFQSNTYLNGKNEEIKLPKDFEECEIVYYYKTKSLCIQGHPEMNSCPKETKDLCISLIKNYLKL